jgi:Protein of unknown function (DUF2490)
MSRKILLLLQSLCFFGYAFTQNKQKTIYEQIWLGYFNQTRFNDRWGMWADFHLRTKNDFVEELSQGIIRLGLTYYLKDDLKLTVGYAYINHFPADNHQQISQPEHRPWQQIQWHQKFKKLRIMQWLRLEERFKRKILNDTQLADGFNFNYRVRYNFFLQTALGNKPFKKGSFSWVLNDELHINFGNQIVYNYFDQNRFFTGFNYFLSEHDNIQFGYMNLFQQLSSGNTFRVVHTIRIFYFHNLDLRKNSL